MAYKTFVAGTEGLASDINTYLMKQTVMVFANTTARDAALTAPTEGMVTYQEASDHLTIYNGTAWIPFDTKITTYTPTFTNFTLGNGVINQARYWKLGKIIFLVVDVSLGTTSSVTGQIQVSLPSTAYASALNQGSLEMTIAGTTYIGSLRGVSTTVTGLNAINASATYATRTTISATIPGTWGSGSRFSLWTMYEEQA